MGVGWDTTLALIGAYFGPNKLDLVETEFSYQFTQPELMLDF